LLRSRVLRRPSMIVVTLLPSLGVSQKVYQVIIFAFNTLPMLGVNVRSAAHVSFNIETRFNILAHLLSLPLPSGIRRYNTQQYTLMVNPTLKIPGYACIILFSRIRARPGAIAHRAVPIAGKPAECNKRYGIERRPSRAERPPHASARRLTSSGFHHEPKGKR
jgi:hypothetical protein